METGVVLALHAFVLPMSLPSVFLYVDALKQDFSDRVWEHAQSFRFPVLHVLPEWRCYMQHFEYHNEDFLCLPGNLSAKETDAKCPLLPNM